MRNIFIVLLSLCSTLIHAQASIASSCSPTLKSSATPSVAPGYVVRLVANDLTDPRGIIFDSDGALLVVESGKGVTALTLEDSDDGCISTTSTKIVVSDTSLDHGIEISNDGKTLYASNPESAYSYDYSPGSQKTSNRKTLVTNMTTTDHTTRTLLLSQFAPGLLVVTRGSTSNIDPLADHISSGHSQIKAFNLTNMTSAYDFDTSGLLLGWGLRNDVGIDEEPIYGGIYSVENSVDQMHRNGVDIHETNPAEELNFLGYLNGTPSSNQGRNFGYPQCYTAWDVSSIPDYSGNVGQQFAIGNIGSNNSDAMCSEQYRQKARLPFHPHMAPLDILFNDAGTAAWVTFHGSWDSNPPVGYKLSLVEFENGEPTEPGDSKTAAVDILSNEDVTQCPNNCFRPVGLAWDSKGRLFMSSDQTGEIYAVLRANGEATSGAGSNATGTVPKGGASGTGSGSSPSQTGSGSVASMSALAVFFGILAYLI